MLTFKTIAFSAVVALSGLSTSAHAGGLIADVLQGAGVLSPRDASDLDRRHDQFKRTVPIYGAAEQIGSAAVQATAAGVALNYGGPAGLVAGRVITDGFNQRIRQERDAAERVAADRFAAEQQARLDQWRAYCADVGLRYDRASHSCS